MDVFKVLNHVKTRLLVWGDPFSSGATDVILCITGNPGIIDFYNEFGLELYNVTKTPICVVGHAGHDIIPEEKSYSMKDDGHLFDLKGQIQHKLDLINNHIDKHSRLHLIGHSIGAWMIVEALQKDPALVGRVASINLLFPTIQKMAITKNGHFINNILRKIHFIAMFLLILFNMLPQQVLKFIAILYLKFKSLPTNFSNRVLKYVNPKILDRVLYLAYDEMDKVVSLNTESINNIKHKVTVIYGQKDGWVPLEYMEDLKPFQPSLKMIEVPYTHEFVLKSSDKVAQLVSNNMKPNQ